MSRLERVGFLVAFLVVALMARAFAQAVGNGNGVTVIGNSAGTTLTIASLPPAADGIANGAANGIYALAQLAGFNGTTNDRVRVDPNATGVLRTTTGGSATGNVPSGAANTVVKASAGRLVRILVTTTGTGTGNVNCFDNASTNSGTIIGQIAATATAGTTVLLEMPASNGITCANVASGPVFTVSYY